MQTKEVKSFRTLFFQNTTRNIGEKLLRNVLCTNGEYYNGNGEYYNTISQPENSHKVTTIRTPMWYLNQPIDILIQEWFKDTMEPY